MESKLDEEKTKKESELYWTTHLLKSLLSDDSQVPLCEGFVEGVILRMLQIEAGETKDEEECTAYSDDKASEVSCDILTGSGQVFLSDHLTTTTTMNRGLEERINKDVVVHETWSQWVLEIFRVYAWNIESFFMISHEQNFLLNNFEAKHISNRRRASSEEREEEWRFFTSTLQAVDACKSVDDWYTILNKISKKIKIFFYCRDSVSSGRVMLEEDEFCNFMKFAFRRLDELNDKWPSAVFGVVQGFMLYMGEWALDAPQTHRKLQNDIYRKIINSSYVDRIPNVVELLNLFLLVERIAHFPDEYTGDDLKKIVVNTMPTNLKIVLYCYVLINKLPNLTDLYSLLEHLVTAAPPSDQQLDEEDQSIFERIPNIFLRNILYLFYRSFLGLDQSARGDAFEEMRDEVVANFSRAKIRPTRPSSPAEVIQPGAWYDSSHCYGNHWVTLSDEIGRLRKQCASSTILLDKFADLLWLVRISSREGTNDYAAQLNLEKMCRMDHYYGAVLADYEIYWRLRISLANYHWVKDRLIMSNNHTKGSLFAVLNWTFKLEFELRFQEYYYTKDDEHETAGYKRNDLTKRDLKLVELLQKYVRELYPYQMRCTEIASILHIVELAIKRLAAQPPDSFVDLSTSSEEGADTIAQQIVNHKLTSRFPRLL